MSGTFSGVGEKIQGGRCLRTAWKGARSGNEGVVGGYDEEEGVGMHFQLPGGWLHVYIFFYV